MLDLHHRYLRFCVLFFFFAFLQSTTFSLQSGGLGPETSLLVGPVVFSWLPLGPIRDLWLNVAVRCW